MRWSQAKEEADRRLPYMGTSSFFGSLKDNFMIFGIQSAEAGDALKKMGEILQNGDVNYNVSHYRDVEHNRSHSHHSMGYAIDINGPSHHRVRR